MSMRFRRSIKLAPGVRLNLSGGGASLTLGPRGASLSFGRRGTYLNTGIPGTGLYARERIGGEPVRRAASSSGQNAIVPSIAKVSIEDDGTVRFLDENGARLDEFWVKKTKELAGGQIRELIEGVADKINQEIEALSEIHQTTPSPHLPPKYDVVPFAEPQPYSPRLKRHGLWGWLLSPVRARIDGENATAKRQYSSRLAEWKKKKTHFDAVERAKKNLFEVRVLTDVDAMQIILEESLKDITWPRETAVSFEVSGSGETVFLDLDLPELEDMPKKSAAAPSRGYRLSIKELSATRVQQLYMRHVHAIGFRIVGEVFAVLPRASELVLSAYSQRADPGTGAINDDYLYSVRVRRDAWERISFSNLAAVDPVEVFTHFDLRREMTKTGRFRPVQVFAQVVDETKVVTVPMYTQGANAEIPKVG